MQTKGYQPRSAVIDALMLLAHATVQLEYERNCPHVCVPTELVESFVSDLYHPKSIEFIDAFSEGELKDLARLYALIYAAGERTEEAKISSVKELLKLPEWRQVMALAKTLYASF